MQKYLIFGLLAAIIIVAFSIQNAEPVDIQLLFWPVQISKALLILFCMLFGALLGILFSWPSVQKRKKEIGLLKKKIDTLTTVEDKTGGAEM